VNPNDPLTIAALSDYVAQTTPGQDGFYVESGYKFFRGIFRNRELFDEGAYVMRWCASKPFGVTAHYPTLSKPGKNDSGLQHRACAERDFSN